MFLSEKSENTEIPKRRQYKIPIHPGTTIVNTLMAISPGFPLYRYSLLNKYPLGLQLVGSPEV